MRGELRVPTRAHGATLGEDRHPIGFSVYRFQINADEFALLTFSVTEPSPNGIRSLTPSERAVYERLVAGWSTVAIAKERHTSARTVANQVAALYRKLKITSRRELRARHAAGETGERDRCP
jgi:DNA-binding NarL/FixJ family response regulator